MSLFNFKAIQGDLFTGGGQRAVHPEGTFQGKITKVTPSKTGAGHRVLNVVVTTDKGEVQTGLNIDHPNCASISMKTIAQILSSYKTPPQTLDMIDDIAAAIRGLPVAVYVKSKGVNDKGYAQYGVYFNRIDDAEKVEFEGGAPKARVEF